MPTIDTQSIRSSLREFVVETFFVGDDAADFEDTDSFMEKGIIDSTGVLELTSFLEERYEIHVEDEEMIPDNLDSISNLVAFIGKKLG